jgi:hypothetical protein
VPLPYLASAHVSASTLSKLTGKRSPAFNVVELFAPKDLPWYPGVSPPGAVCRQTRGSPRRTTLNAPCERKRAPCVDYAMHVHGLTDFETDGLRQNTIARFSASPPFGAKEIRAIG